MRVLRVLALLLALALAGSAGTYTVRAGDTLGAIAARVGSSVPALAWVNHLGDPNRLREGQVLQVPGGPPSSPAPVASRAVLHRVARGETLGGIAAQHHTTVAALVRLNHLPNANVVHEGQLLRVDDAPAATWVCPVPGPVRFVSPFGAARGGGTRHLGVDVAAPEGTVVVANVSGTLLHHPNPKGGNAYILRGDDGHSYYGAHLERYLAPEGKVRLGQAIGRVGETGDAAGTLPHLHFEWWRNGGAAVDPMSLLRAACQDIPT